MRRRYIGAHGRLGAWQQLWEARNLQHLCQKIEHTSVSSVHNETLESGTWHKRLWTWQQHEEAV
ncbi:unnamed protein product [Staurois parvus]|uniref:Uncharacterized protein n=1 Tax=Staurois parvus TaxID=386267 RepID=A0ABN9APQ5_9NEOB|nr:unnamed protein product [Staurois parvus]